MPPLDGIFMGLAMMLATAFVGAVARAFADDPARQKRATALAVLGTAAWLGLTAVAASSGWLNFDGTPPTMIVLFVAVLALGVGIGASSLGLRIATSVPFAWLVGVQGFRFPLEFMMYRAYLEGLMPVQMSFAGRNWDVVTGCSAIVLAFVLAFAKLPVRTTKWLVSAWSALGIALLVNILVIALLSAPTPWRYFQNEPANVWITQFPWVWLPAVMVLSAIMGHTLLLRRLMLVAR